MDRPLSPPPLLPATLCRTPPMFYRRAIAQIGDDYAAGGWSETTPDFFVHDYLPMLADLGDLTRSPHTGS